MATDVEIASLALTRIGHDTISSFSASGNKAQRWFYANFDYIKQSLLREYAWNFATKRVALSAATAPVNEYTNAFTLPADFLRLVRLNGSPTVSYRIEGSTLVTYETSATIEYIFDANVSTANSQFADLLAARFSAEICFFLTDNTQLTEQAWKLYQEKLAAAQMADSQEARPRYKAANMALLRIGETAPRQARGDSGPVYETASRLIESSYDVARKALLREHAWTFAIKRAVPTADTVRTITGATKANPVVITSASHGFTNGQTVYINNVVGMTELNGRTFTVTSAATNTFALSGINGTAYTTYASGGSAYGYVATEYAYRFPLPSDCLRLLRVGLHEMIEHRVEGSYIYANEQTIHIEYISDVSDEAAFDALFLDCLAQRLAAEAMPAVTKNAGDQRNAWTLYDQKLSMARTMDSRQSTPRPVLSDDPWLMSRL